MVDRKRAVTQLHSSLPLTVKNAVDVIRPLIHEREREIAESLGFVQPDVDEPVAVPERLVEGADWKERAERAEAKLAAIDVRLFREENFDITDAERLEAIEDVATARERISILTADEQQIVQDWLDGNEREPDLAQLAVNVPGDEAERELVVRNLLLKLGALDHVLARSSSR